MESIAMDILDKLSPLDEYNTRLIENVFPQPWINPSPRRHYDVAVIGGGIAGYTAARQAAAHGARTALIQNGPLGGSYLNFTDVPLHSMAHHAYELYSRRGAESPETITQAHFGKVMELVRKTRCEISERYRTFTVTNEGIHLFFGVASFTSKKTLVVDGSEIKFKRAVIATGAQEIIPDVPGLDQCGYFTHENIFTLTDRPHSVAVYGYGNHACEIAQIYRHLGSHVMIINPKEHLLPQEDPQVYSAVEKRFDKIGIRVLDEAELKRVELHEEKRMLHVDWKSTDEQYLVDALIISNNTRGSLESLNLDAAGIQSSESLITVDKFLRTSTSHIYAAGDCCLMHKLAHLAEKSGRIAAHNALFANKRKVNDFFIPVVLHTNPPAARVGLNQKEAEKNNIGYKLFQSSYTDIDRAPIERKQAGFVQVLVQRRSDVILGATVLGEHAPEIINMFTLAMQTGIGLKQLDSILYPQATYSEIVKSVARKMSSPEISAAKRSILSMWYKLRG